MPDGGKLYLYLATEEATLNLGLGVARDTKYLGVAHTLKAAVQACEDTLEYGHKWPADARPERASGTVGEEWRCYHPDKLNVQFRIRKVIIIDPEATVIVTKAKSPPASTEISDRFYPRDYPRYD
jgi:hypothetical protein